ncbi:MAG: uroporphyrinogen-III C-methyltransferase [Pseudomonadota bacterium]
MSTFVFDQFFQRFGFTNKRKLFADKTIGASVAFDPGVYIIGGGCGDPELITVKAQRIIEQADVLLVDWLVNPVIYQSCRKDCEVIFVGKKCGRHSVTQAEIDNLLVECARKYQVVGRLKGGDPSIFGRLAEETSILTENSIPFCVVPGITAASGCAAYSGIPLTMRDVAQSVKFITAHYKNSNEEPIWEDLVQDSQTLVFYMGLTRINMIATRLISAGMSNTMPIAVIQQGTLDQQSVWTGSLDDAKHLNLEKLQGPALIVVGEVVKYRQQVNLSMVRQASTIGLCNG